MSSGQLVIEATEYRHCDGWINEDTEVPCDFVGQVDVWVDPEVNLTGWTCPACGTEHEGAL